MNAEKDEVTLEFTTVQKRMLEVLSDGMRHTRNELHACLEDEMGPVSNIYPHIHAIRKKLAKIGHAIVCEIEYQSTYYRHVRLLNSKSSDE